MNQKYIALGEYVPNWESKEFPHHKIMAGRFCSIEPLDLSVHAEDLHKVYSLEPEGTSWTYLPYGPFETFAAFENWLIKKMAEPDALLYCILDIGTKKPIGMSGYLRINPDHGVIEIGDVHFSSLLKKTPAATEAMYLLMHHVFEELKYRRYEWKCNNLNEASKKAAQRLGFQFEGIFRQCNVFKNHNRDTAWFSIIDKDWPRIQKRFMTWLDPSNFTIENQQRLRLQDC